MQPPGPSPPPTTSSDSDYHSSDFFSFPCFRGDDWIKKIFRKDVLYPDEVLEGVDLTPKYITQFPTASLFPAKVHEVCEQLRRTLFRQALFKVQNCEVTYMDSCKEDRILERIGVQEVGKWWYDITNPSDTYPIREELWSIRRCEQVRDYRIRYYSEGQGDGYSTAVIPMNWRDKLALFYFYVVA